MNIQIGILKLNIQMFVRIYEGLKITHLKGCL